MLIDMSIPTRWRLSSLAFKGRQSSLSGQMADIMSMSGSGCCDELRLLMVLANSELQPSHLLLATQRVCNTVLWCDHCQCIAEVPNSAALQAWKSDTAHPHTLLTLRILSVHQLLGKGHFLAAIP